jgi:hypothetical protein
MSNVLHEKVEYGLVSVSGRIVHMFTDEETRENWITKAKELGRYPNLRKVEIRTSIVITE